MATTQRNTTYDPPTTWTICLKTLAAQCRLTSCPANVILSSASGRSSRLTKPCLTARAICQQSRASPTRTGAKWVISRKQKKNRGTRSHALNEIMVVFLVPQVKIWMIFIGTLMATIDCKWPSDVSIGGTLRLRRPTLCVCLFFL